MKTNHIFTIIKGAIIGGTMLVPGVSGGTMAMTLSIYNELISSISNIKNWKKRDLIFVALFVLGAAMGMLLLARPILMLMERFPKPTIFFFLGAVAGAIPMIWRCSQVTKVSIKHIVYVFFGVAIMVVLTVIPTELIHPASTSGILWFLLLILAGFISAVGFVLPGISFSYFLLLLGLYDSTMRAISRLDILFLLPLVIGLAIGILVATKLLDKAMRIYPHATYLIILGFVIGSLIEAFPGVPMGSEWLWCIVTASVGFGAILLLSRRS